MPNILENYLSVQDGKIYHFRNFNTQPYEFFNEAYQIVGKGRTNLEQPYRIPNAEKFVVKVVQVIIIPQSPFYLQFPLPLFEISVLVGDSEVFNLHLCELYPNVLTYQIDQSTEGTLSTKNALATIFGKPNSYIGLTKGLEIEILRNVNFKAVVKNIENTIPNTVFGLVFYGTFYRLITG